MKTIGSLSEDGWIVDSKKLLDRIISYYITTDSRQTYLFQGNLISLPKTYYLYINDPEGMKRGIIDDLTTLLGRYFNVVEINANVELLDTNSSKYAITLSVRVTDENNKYIELAKFTEYENGALNRIVDINNYGTGLELTKNAI